MCVEIRTEINNDHSNITRYVLYQALKSSRLSLKKVVVRCCPSCMAVGIINSCPKLNELVFELIDSYSNMSRIIGPRPTRGLQLEQQSIPATLPTIINDDNGYNITTTVDNPGYQRGGDDNEEKEYDYYFDKLKSMFLSEPLISYKPGSNITHLEPANPLFNTPPNSFWQYFPTLQHLAVRIPFIISLSTLVHDILHHCPNMKMLDLGPALG